MRLRTHVLSAAVAAALLYPRSPGRALLLVAGGVLIDLDHVLVYALRTGDWSLEGAVRYNRYRHLPVGPGDTRPRYGSLRSWLHQPVVLLPLWLAALASPAVRALAWGVTLHLILDYLHLPRVWQVRRRARGRCELCGRRARLRVHYLYRDGPGRRGRHTAVCRPCCERYFDLTASGEPIVVH